MHAAVGDRAAVGKLGCQREVEIGRMGGSLDRQMVDHDRRVDGSGIAALDHDGVAVAHVAAPTAEDGVRRGVEREIERVDRVGDDEAMGGDAGRIIRGASPDDGIVGAQQARRGIDHIGVGGVGVAVGRQDLVDLAYGREIGPIVVETAQDDGRRVVGERAAGNGRDLRGRQQPWGARSISAAVSTGLGTTSIMSEGAAARAARRK